MMDPTERQKTWKAASDKAAREGDFLSAGFFALLTLPNEAEQAAAAELRMLDDAARHESWLVTDGADYLFENGHGE